MEQRAAIHFFQLMGTNSKVIHPEFESVHGPASLALLAVTKWRKRFHQTGMNLSDDSASGRPLTNNLGGAIEAMLEERPFSSCKVLCRHFRIGKATYLRILHDKLGLRNSIFAEHRIPYRSTRRAT
jgi:hypothetical protein